MGGGLRTGATLARQQTSEWQGKLGTLLGGRCWRGGEGGGGGGGGGGYTGTSGSGYGWGSTLENWQGLGSLVDVSTVGFWAQPCAMRDMKRVLLTSR